MTTTIEVVNTTGIDKYLNNLTDYPPAGYVLQGVTGTVYRGAGASLNDPRTFDGTATQSGNGSVQVKWTDATLKLAKLGTNRSSKHPTLTFTYKVSDSAAVGPRTAGVSYSIYGAGSPSFNPMSGLNLSVEATPTSTSLSVPATASAGQTVTLAAQVDPAKAGAVQFKDGGADIGAPVPVSNGTATLSHAFADSGERSITAQFVPSDANVAGSTSSPQTITVSDVATTLALSGPATAVSGTEITLTADVTPANAAGTVQFKDNGTPIGSTVTVANGKAVLPHTFTTSGAHSITADFIGSAGFTNTTAPAHAVTVSDPDQQTSLNLQLPASATSGESVTLTAKTTPQNAHGTVQFKVDGTPVGNPVTVVDGVATAPHTFDVAGSFAVTADFVGATGFTNTTAAAQNIVVAAPVVETALSLAVSPSATTGESTDLSASVTPVPTGGTVQFTVAGANVGAPVTVDAAGRASLPHTFGVAGEFAVAAVYSGATGFTGSTAQPQTVTVTDPAPVDVETSTLVGVPGTATTGTDTTLSVTVQPKSGTAVPTGSVQFRDNGNPIGAPVTLDNGSASLTHTFTTAGTHQITAVYTPDAGFVGSTSSQRPIVVAAPNPTDITSSVVVTSTQSATVGTAFTLKVQVIGADTLPGTVQFFDGAVEIGQPVAVVNGVAELVHTFTTSGPHQIHAVYSGGAGVAGSTSPVQIVDVAAGGGNGNGDDAGAGSLGSLSGLRLGF